MIVSVVREYKWLPNQIGSFFIDDNDIYGIEFWYNDVMKQVKALEKDSKNNPA